METHSEVEPGSPEQVDFMDRWEHDGNKAVALEADIHFFLAYCVKQQE